MVDFENYYIEREFKITPFPNICVFDTVNACNLNCSMCGRQNMQKRDIYMPWELYTKGIDEIAQKNPKAKVWMVYYGEPFMRAKKSPSIFDMIQYAKDKGCENVVVNTNACLMNMDNMIKLVKTGVNSIYIGLDGFSEKSYSQNRVGGNYEKTKENVLNLLKYTKENNITELEIVIQFIEMDNNIHERDEFIEFWTNQGAFVKIRPMLTWINNTGKDILTSGIEKRTTCSWATDIMVVTSDGRVPKCVCDYNIKHSVGNVIGSSLESVWKDKMQELHKIYVEEQKLEITELCKDCPDWQLNTQKTYPPK